MTMERTSQKMTAGMKHTLGLRVNLEVRTTGLEHILGS